MENEKKYLFDKPDNVKRLLHFLYGCCAVLLALDFVIHRHVVHSWENLWGFYPLYGFVGCVVLVLVATWMRTFLMRSEDYYADEGKTEYAETSDDVKNNITKKHGAGSGDDNVDA
ncbi:MAG: hypothetical protein KZQ64_03350 [gamma proteobacterium symbiont of Bathyaustriella thionipta]|nr:hypothetical protein [gamma proteobacterium symbiont of Bathyaustriella thionipta]MCU7950047.1 hypothetical protein [gamma proteobacterium symbiont of Bathyaustriella thionipta]MCU7952418.1 hypothetical protein [gamma proteobacterium symbiont of Bathyaustriella thionipta]MCU7956643.1 hypothetical protein [gamma proteobacterium symbiont of Bathyaustriella thionipta]